MTRRQVLLYGAIGGLMSAAALLTLAVVAFHVDELLDHLVGNR